MTPDVVYGPLVAETAADVVVIGGGACGLVAALAAADAGAEVIVLERDASPSGSTAMSSGFIPAPGTRFQRAAGVTGDGVEAFLEDIAAKTKGMGEARLARLAAERIGPALDWLATAHGLDWQVLTEFLYPGHSHHRMHTVPERTGAALMARLLAAVEAAGIPVVTEAHAVRLHREGARMVGATVERPGGARETLGCDALILACNGYGGNPDLVRRHIPEIADGAYYGHAGNTGDAVIWGDALGAASHHLSGYQGHGSLAHPHGILITWALMMEGAVQLNTEGRRFSNEHGGYSEQATAVLAQPGGVAWTLYDAERHRFALSFPDYVQAVEAGAVREAADLPALATATGLPTVPLAETLAAAAAAHAGAADAFGRDFRTKPPLTPPYFAVRVTGALFHTQGGLMIDGSARVLDGDGRPFANLFAGGGAACGVSGPDVSGYLSGNGLLTAIAFGAIAGEAAGALTAQA
ncbi:MAG: FAD-dependent oxidoreductase [Pseudomonadota bacterium]